MLDVLCTGHAAFDITMTVPHHPASNEKMLADDLVLGGGGPAANAAVQVARLGGSAGFCGYIGRDLFGDAHLAELHAEGVHTGLVQRGAHPTPLSQVLAKPDGTRSLVNFKGDTAWLPSDAVSLQAVENLQPRVMLFDGHEPLLSPPLCDRAKQCGTPSVLDAGSLHRGTELLARQVDYLVASETFAAQVAATHDADAALDVLAGMAPCAVITLGEQGLIWQRNGERGRLPAFDVQAIDSTGAGDAFHGAFALALARGLDWQQTLRFASAAGALTCTRAGARAALPDSRAMQALLESS